jgi:hypothetical protein
MDQPDRTQVTPAAFAFDAVLTLAVFVFLTWLLRNHVPSNDPFWVWLWGAVGASCLTALFWLCLRMFRAVVRAQIEAKRK